MKDFYNSEVKAGDVIVYATRQSSHVYLHKATVVEIVKRSTINSGREYLRVRRDESLESPWVRRSSTALLTLTNPKFVIMPVISKPDLPREWDSAEYAQYLIDEVGDDMPVDKGYSYRDIHDHPQDRVGQYRG